MAQQRNVVTRGQVANKVENADSFAGDCRVREFLVYDDDMEPAGWTRVALV